MTKTFFRRLLTCVAAAFVCIGLLEPESQAEAADYWCYTSSSGEQYYVVPEKSSFLPKMGNKHVYVKIVETDNSITTRDYGFGFDEGQWWFGRRNTHESLPVASYPFAQAIVDFCNSHWDIHGCHE